MSMLGLWGTWALLVGGCAEPLGVNETGYIKDPSEASTSDSDVADGVDVDDTETDTEDSKDTLTTDTALDTVQPPETDGVPSLDETGCEDSGGCETGAPVVDTGVSDTSLPQDSLDAKKGLGALVPADDTDDCVDTGGAADTGSDCG